MRKLILLLILVILVNCASEKASIKSPLSSTEIKKMSAAKSFEEIFEMESTIQLSTAADCAIALITDAVVDAKGNYIVADGWQRRAVYIFSPDGKFIKELGRKGQGPGEYSTPVSLEISSKKEIWVADYMANRIIIYDESFNFERFMSCKPRVYHFLHLSSHDEIYMYSGSVNPFHPVIFNTIHKYDPQGEEIFSFAPLPGETLNIKFSAVQDGMTIDRDDFIYEMNPLYYNIRKFSSDGKMIKAFSRKTNLFKVITKEGETPIIICGPYYLEKGLIIAQVSKHLEIYDTEGNFIVGELPFSQKIIAAKGNRLYVEQWEEKNRSEIQLNPKIICYKLKI